MKIRMRQEKQLQKKSEAINLRTILFVAQEITIFRYQFFLKCYTFSHFVRYIYDLLNFDVNVNSLIRIYTLPIEKKWFQSTEMFDECTQFP